MFRFLVSTSLLFLLSGCLSINSESDGSFNINGQRVTVPTEVDGKPVPPDPGNKGEDTLLGIDSNDNGVRDDVERYIYARFQGFENAEIDRAVAMQYARATQIIIQNPETAYEDWSYKVMHDAIDCQWYYFDTFLRDVEDYQAGAEYRSKHKVFDADMEDVVFNTRERLEAYLAFNDSLSGHIYDSRPHVKEKCDFDIDKLLGLN